MQKKKQCTKQYEGHIQCSCFHILYINSTLVYPEMPLDKIDNH